MFREDIINTFCAEAVRVAPEDAQANTHVCDLILISFFMLSPRNIAQMASGLLMLGKSEGAWQYILRAAALVKPADAHIVRVIAAFMKRFLFEIKSSGKSLHSIVDAVRAIRQLGSPS